MTVQQIIYLQFFFVLLTDLLKIFMTPVMFDIEP